MAEFCVYESHGGICEKTGGYCNPGACAYEELKEFAPVVYGDWLLRHIGAGHYWECSVCHTNPCIYVTEHTKFCPNCGAKMDGGSDELFRNGKTN